MKKEKKNEKWKMKNEHKNIHQMTPRSNDFLTAHARNPEAKAKKKSTEVTHGSNGRMIWRDIGEVACNPYALSLHAIRMPVACNWSLIALAEESSASLPPQDSRHQYHSRPTDEILFLPVYGGKLIADAGNMWWMKLVASVNALTLERVMTQQPRHATEIRYYS